MTDTKQTNERLFFINSDMDMNGLNLVEMELFMTDFIVAWWRQFATFPMTLQRLTVMITNIKKCRVSVKPSQKMLWMTSGLSGYRIGLRTFNAVMNNFPQKYMYSKLEFLMVDLFISKICSKRITSFLLSLGKKPRWHNIWQYGGMGNWDDSRMIKCTVQYFIMTEGVWLCGTFIKECVIWLISFPCSSRKLQTVLRNKSSQISN